MKKFIAILMAIMIVIMSISSASAAVVSTADEISASIKVGDVDGSGKITIDDATALQKYLANISNKTFYKSKADYNYDGKISIDDVSMLQKSLADMIVEYSNGYYEVDRKNKKCNLINYHGTSSSVTIPSTVNGCNVTEIMSYSFQNNSSIVTITVPNTVIKINDYAFYNCKNLTKMIYKNKNMKWGYSFVECPKFQSMTLG
ncbi:MAG: leucine-rich repeat protein [Ruminococcus sp.]|nr:leucine-rich repeat protein [Ruminococcus sp.]